MAITYFDQSIRSFTGLLKGLSRMHGDMLVRFLGEATAVTSLPYPTNTELDMLFFDSRPLKEAY